MGSISDSQRITRHKDEGPSLNIIDKTVSFFNPEAGHRRLAARCNEKILHEFSLMGYESASTYGRRGSSGGMYANNSSENWSKNRDRIRLIWDARQLCANSWLGGVAARIVLYCLGEAKMRSNTGDPAINTLYDEYVDDWAGEELDEDEQSRCDMSGRHSLLKMAQMALLADFVDGDNGAKIIEEEDEMTGAPKEDLKLQQIEADRIGSPLEAQVEENYICGISLDPQKGGRVKGYRIFDRTRVGMYTNPQEVEPRNFIHIIDPFRSDQYRGVSAFKACTPYARGINEWLTAEQMAGKVQSQYAAGVVTKDPVNSGLGKWEGTTSAGTPYQNAEWGKMLKLADGEDIKFFSPANRPGPAAMNLMQTLIRLIAIAINWPYGMLWDLSTLGGVSQRVEVELAQRTVGYFQQLMVQKLFRRVRRLVISRGIAFGKLPPHPAWKKCNYHFGKWLVTDAGYELDNDTKLLQFGLVTHESVCYKYGSGSSNQVAQKNASTIQEMQAITGATRVPIEMLAPLWQPQATQLLAATATPPAPPPKPGSLEAIGEKPAAQVAEILANVTQGKMDRDSAIEQLKTVYGFTPQMAEAIVPPQGKPPEPGGGGSGEGE